MGRDRGSPWEAVADVLTAAGKTLEFEGLPSPGVDSRGNTNATPLILAAIWNDPDATALLLHAGAQVNEANDEGWTALHFAASTDISDNPTDRACSLRVVELLMDHHADPRLKDASGRTPADKAKLHRRDDMLARMRLTKRWSGP